MNIIIGGAGEVGRYAAEVLGADPANDITIVDHNAGKLAAVEESLDVRCLLGSATHGNVLREAGAPKADLFIAATNIDEVNLLAASLAKGVGVAKSIARVNHSAYFESQGMRYDRQLGIDHLVCPIYSTAVSIAQKLRNPGALAFERFAEGKIEMQRISVSDNAPAVGKTLAALGMPGGVRLAAIEHADGASIPTGLSRIREDDIVTLVGQGNPIMKARGLFRNDPPGRTRVVIIGGSMIGVWLCRALQSRQMSIRLFETDRARAEELAAKLDWVTVIHADPSDPEFLEEERIDQVDAFITVTDDDEHNILVAARGKAQGADMAITVLQRSTYLHLLNHVGIDAAFSPRISAVHEIQQLLAPGPIHHLATLAEGVAELYDVRVPPGARKVIDVPLREAKLPPQTLIAAVERGETVMVPGASDTLSGGDRVVIVAPTGSEKALRELFGLRS